MSLQKLSPTLYLDDPVSTPSATSGPRASDPNLIILFAWMDAALPHAKKYTDQYRKMFPYTPLVLLLTPSSVFMRRTSTNLKNLKPAYNLITSRMSPTNPASSSSTTLVPPLTPKVLIHTFSNGGCMSLKHLDELYRSSTPNSGVPAKCLIIDSAPGTASDLGVTIRAFTAVFDKRPVLKFVMSGFIAVFFGMMKLVGTLIGRPSPITLMSNYLLTHFPQPRLFLYSPNDKLVPYKEIERHAAEVRAKGVEVEMVRFEGTGHVNHVKGEENKERYWSKVREFWEGTGTEKKGRNDCC